MEHYELIKERTHGMLEPPGLSCAGPGDVLPQAAEQQVRGAHQTHIHKQPCARLWSAIPALTIGGEIRCALLRRYLEPASVVVLSWMLLCR